MKRPDFSSLLNPEVFKPQNTVFIPHTATDSLIFTPFSLQIGFQRCD